MLPFSRQTSEVAAGPSPRSIQAGDLVIVYENQVSMKAVYVEQKGQFQNRFGAFMHKDWLGRPFGSKVYCKGSSKGWVYLLAPSPDLWSLVLKHRTQILYIADISVVCFNLELSPGCVVLETGTGSGSLTHSLARAVAPAGHVHTFEFHPQRAQEAAKEFAAHGLSSVITVRQRNIEERGFPDGSDTEPDAPVRAPQQPGQAAPPAATEPLSLAGCADAVFLDLPGPWKVVKSAARCLKPDGRFCSFSPCIEQVQRTCEALEAEGFTDIRTIEVLLRVHEVRTERFTTSFEPPAQQAGRGQQAGWKRKRPDGEAAPQAEGAAEPEAASCANEGPEPATGAAAEGSGADAGAADASMAAAEGCGAPESSCCPGEGGEAEEAAAPEAEAAAVEAAPLAAAGSGSMTYVTSRPAMDARGHTGYLTFARKFV